MLSGRDAGAPDGGGFVTDAPDGRYVFVSYSREDAEYVEHLASLIR
jgi:hypothetical protein